MHEMQCGMFYDVCPGVVLHLSHAEGSLQLQCSSREKHDSKQLHISPSERLAKTNEEIDIP